MAAWQIVAGRGPTPLNRTGREPNFFVGLTPAGSVVRTSDPDQSRFTSEAMAKLVAGRHATPYDDRAFVVLETDALPAWADEARVVATGPASEVFEVAPEGDRVYRSSASDDGAPLAYREALYVAALAEGEGHGPVRVERVHQFA